MHRVLPLNGSFPVRFIRDIFVENYDPTIEGQWLVVTVMCCVLTSLIEQYRKTITVDGQLDMVCLLSA